MTATEQELLMRQEQPQRYIGLLEQRLAEAERERDAAQQQAKNWDYKKGMEHWKFSYNQERDRATAAEARVRELEAAVRHVWLVAYGGPEMPSPREVAEHVQRVWGDKMDDMQRRIQRQQGRAKQAEFRLTQADILLSRVLAGVEAPVVSTELEADIQAWIVGAATTQPIQEES